MMTPLEKLICDLSNFTTLDEMMGNHMELEGFVIDPKYKE